MRTRAYRPEVPGCLEDRSLLSGAAGLSADPVVLSRLRLNKVAEHVRASFLTFARDAKVFHEVSHLGDDIYDAVVVIPFGRVDGLGVSINRILSRMQHDLSAHVPHAITSARDDVLAVIRADVEARVRAGDVVVR
jgi:hypothetical protein